MSKPTLTLNFAVAVVHNLPFQMCLFCGQFEVF